MDVVPNFNKGKSEFPVAVMMEGKFTSAFENRLPENFLKLSEIETKLKSVPTKMLVVSDGDIIRNEVDSKVVDGQTMYKAIPMEVDIFGARNPNNTPKYVYGNKDFVLNAIDYMVDDFSLIDVRAKTITLRVLDRQAVNDEKEFWKFINIGIPLLFISILAMIQFFIRKRKYTRSFPTEN